jgi:hypothetical protein
MRKFILVFTQKEGSSPIIQILDHFDQVSVIHQVQGEGFEPFNDHNCGPMPIASLRACLDIIYGAPPIDFDALNSIYMQTAVRALEEIEPANALGLKMRFVPPAKSWSFLRPIPRLAKKLRPVYVRYQVDYGPFRRMMFDVLSEHSVLVLMAIRQDVFRWALSRYHGDGWGRRGHLQFALKAGDLARENIPRIHVDPERFESVIRHCEALHDRKRRLVSELRASGIMVYPLLYEEFVRDPHQFFTSVLKVLETDVSRDEIDDAIKHGTEFQRVHSGDLSDYVVNHREIENRFAGRFIPWRVQL